MSDLKEMNVLIIGGSGFVGSTLVATLLSEQARITLLNRGTRKVPGTALFEADRNKPSEMRVYASPNNRFDAVIDLSCYNQSQAKTAWEIFSPLTPKWIHLSSASIYSTPPSVTPKEDAPVGGAPIWGDYGRDKSEADVFLLGTNDGPELTILRPPYLYGPGNDNDRETFVWSRALNEYPVLVPGDGTTPIQFLHVKDLGGIIVKLLKTSHGEKKVYNAAAKEQLPLKDFVRRLALVCGKPDPTALVEDEDRDFTPRDYFPFRNYPCRVDTGLINRELEWTSEYDFDRGFADTYQTYDPEVLRSRELDRKVEKIILERLEAEKN